VITLDTIPRGTKHTIRSGPPVLSVAFLFFLRGDSLVKGEFFLLPLSMLDEFTCLQGEENLRFLVSSI
jgi:hypothetical protein